MELKEYRKRLAATTSAAGYSPPPSATQSRNYHNGNGDDFQFAFPKFGDLPGASFMSNGTIAKTSSPPLAGQPQRSASASTATSPGILRKQSSSSTSTKSPTNANGASATPMGQSRSYQAPFNGFNTNSFDELNELFSPSILENASRRSTVDYLSSASSRAASTSSVPKQGNTIGQTQMPAMRHGSSTSITGSPSSMSHGALDSSCGTTPESSADSPDNRKSNEGTLNTISEEGKYQNNIGGKERSILRITLMPSYRCFLKLTV